jgi:hypothetical protein
MKNTLFLDEKVFLYKNFNNKTYKELLDNLNSNRPKNNQLSYPTLRHRFRDLGLARYKMIHWAKVHEKFLKQNYRTKGNTEIAKILSSNKFRSKKVFTADKVRKKMELLNLHRTKEELSFVVQRNIKLGLTYVNKPGQAVVPGYPEGHISIRPHGKLLYQFIKVNGKYRMYGRWNYENKIGKVPDGHILFRMDLDSLNDDLSNYEIRKPRSVMKNDLIRALKITEERLKLINIKTDWDEFLRLDNHKRKIENKLKKK